jgi:hypothetical protein
MEIIVINLKNKFFTVFFKAEQFLNAMLVVIFFFVFFIMTQNSFFSLILSILFLFIIEKIVKNVIRKCLNRSVVGNLAFSEGTVVLLNKNGSINRVFETKNILEVQLKTDKYLFYKNYYAIRNTGITYVLIKTIEGSFQYTCLIDNKLQYEKILEIIPKYKYLTLLNKRLKRPLS